MYFQSMTGRRDIGRPWNRCTQFCYRAGLDPNPCYEKNI